MRLLRGPTCAEGYGALKKGGGGDDMRDLETPFDAVNSQVRWYLAMDI